MRLSQEVGIWSLPERGDGSEPVDCGPEYGCVHFAPTNGNPSLFRKSKVPIFARKRPVSFSVHCGSLHYSAHAPGGQEHVRDREHSRAKAARWSAVLLRQAIMRVQEGDCARLLSLE